MNYTMLAVRHKDDVDIIDLYGIVLRSEEHKALQAAIRRLVSSGSTRILINMAEIIVINQAVVWPLMQMCIDTAKAGVKAKLLNVGEPVKTKLETTGIYSIFETEEDEESAIRSLSTYAASHTAPGSEYFLG
jgi:anti-sigma B factor antagonist